jgi:hypothetical protein
MGLVTRLQVKVYQRVARPVVAHQREFHLGYLQGFVAREKGLALH